MQKSELSVDREFAQFRFLEEGKFDDVLLGEFNAMLDKITNDQIIQCLVITGSGKNFSQGLDLDYLMTLDANLSMGFVESCMEAIGRMITLPIPVVSAVNGHAFGLGAMITLASDYAAMRADKGFFCLPEIDIRSNLTPSMNTLVTSKLQGRVLRDVLLTGKRLGGKDAEALGIVDKSCTESELLTSARQLSEPMRGKDRKVLSQLKAGINRDFLAMLPGLEKQ